MFSNKLFLSNKTKQMEILMKQDNSDDTIVRIWGNEGIKWINIGMSNTHNKFEDIEKAA